MSLDLEDLQRRQRAYDNQHWDHSPGFDTVRHTANHIGKTVGKLFTYVEAVEHGAEASREVLEHEVIPDLLMHAARLANDGSLDLEELFNTRMSELRVRFSNPTH